MDVKVIRKLFAAMKSAGVQAFEHTAADGTTVKIMMREEETVETDARSVGFVQADPEDEDGDEGELKTKRNVGFQPTPPDSKPGLYDSRTLHLKDFAD